MINKTEKQHASLQKKSNQENIIYKTEMQHSSLQKESSKGKYDIQRRKVTEK